MASALAKIHIGKKALGLDDETYQAYLLRLTGRSSAKELTEGQLGRVIEDMRAKGAFKTALNAASNSAQKHMQSAYAKKLQALWIAGWNLGIIKSKTDKALIAFVERQTGLSHLRFLHYHDDAARAIEGLKAWIGREAGISWGNAGDTDEFAPRIAFAQWQLLRAAGVKSVKKGDLNHLISGDFTATVITFCGASPNRGDWIELMNLWGKEARRSRDGASS